MILFKHLGNILEINGYNIEPVDVVTGGSPCQDFSVASRVRQGLDGERSGLFLEQIRVIKEMREHDKSSGRVGAEVRPRYMVLENVGGIFSSNEGQDFKKVLEEIIRIEEPGCPDLPQSGRRGGRWPKSGCVYDGVGQRWSIAWRVHDAQFWGVAQRRKRVSLVVDFGGLSAPEICFERKGLRWDSGESGEEREDTPADAQAETDGAISFVERAGRPGGGKGILIQVEKSGTISTVMSQRVCAPKHEDEPHQPTMIEMTSTKNTIIENGICPTLTARMGTGGNQVNAVFALQSFGEYVETASAVSAVKARDYKDATDLVCSSRDDVRRLTPLEVERLQGFPDGWTDIGSWIDSNGKLHKESSDTHRYMALGNSIATPFWFYLLKRISAQYERPATLGSLFDGISGFPYCWARLNGLKNCRWSSEINDFSIAVCKKHFGDEDAGLEGDFYEVVKGIW